MMPIGGCPGLFHDQGTESILAFGGWISPPIRNTQSFSLTQHQWRVLRPKMKYPRSCFAPCQHDNSVYLAGGYASFGETFSLNTCSFRVFSWHSFFRPWTVSFPTGDYISLLNENGWYRIHTGITLKEKKVPLRLPLIKNAAMENQNIIVSIFPTVIILNTKL